MWTFELRVARRRERQGRPGRDFDEGGVDGGETVDNEVGVDGGEKANDEGKVNDEGKADDRAVWDDKDNVDGVSKRSWRNSIR